jgi:hypothetical protein
MNDQIYGENFYQRQCEIFVEKMRERDLQIVGLQKEQEQMQERLNDLAMFENFVVVARQFVEVMLKPQKQIH